LAAISRLHEMGKERRRLDEALSHSIAAGRNLPQQRRRDTSVEGIRQCVDNLCGHRLDLLVLERVQKAIDKCRVERLRVPDSRRPRRRTGTDTSDEGISIAEEHRQDPASLRITGGA
jgi:hypothetical protein